MYPETQLKISKMLAANLFPGVSYAFVCQDKVEKQIIGAVQAVPHYEVLQNNQQYDVASLTKVIGTTTVLLKLWEQNSISFDDPVKKYLPNFVNEQVTLRHLLTHTSGLDSYIPHRDQLNASELKQAMMGLQVTGDFDKKAVYTDVGFILLGFVIEAIYGESVQQVITEQVLQPLAMQNATFQPIDVQNCVPTENHVSRGLIRGIVHDPKAYVLGEHCGSAGLFATLNDCLKFVDMLLHDGKLPDGQIFLQTETIAMLQQDYSMMKTEERSLGWNLLTSQDQDQHFILYHTGFTGTFMCIDLVTKEAFVFLSNRIHPVSPNDQFLVEREALLEIYLQEKAKIF